MLMPALCPKTAKRTAILIIIKYKAAHGRHRRFNEDTEKNVLLLCLPASTMDVCAAGDSPY